MTNQAELTTMICLKPQQFAWFLGAGASAVAGLPTAWNLIWDLKKRQYCRDQNQEISRQDVQIDSVRSRIQSYLESKGYPKEGDVEEYTKCFQVIFGDDRERQRQYVAAMLSEKNVTLSIGNRVLGALLSTGRTRAVFTTNFDTVVERAVAEVSGQSLAAYHLEGASSATNAINAEEFPFYCKLHGDFRFDSIKNLKADLAVQNADLCKALLTSANRFGFVVSGYSGRDDSVMAVLRSALSTPNPFPHGLFWTVMKGSVVLPTVTQFIADAKSAGVVAEIVEIETFDALMLRIWRNIEGKEPAIDAKVRRSQLAQVNIPLPEAGSGLIVRMNALPVLSLPNKCQEITFRTAKEWSDLRAATIASGGKLIFTKSDAVFCWGKEALIRGHFGTEVASITDRDISPMVGDLGRHLHVKGFLEEAICCALVREKPLLTRSSRVGSYLIANPSGAGQSSLGSIKRVVGAVSGQVTGLFAPADSEHPEKEQVTWAEACRVSMEVVSGRCWLILDPTIWIWPPRARKDATIFLDKRRSNRYNKVYNDLLDSWCALLLGSLEDKTNVGIAAYEGGTEAETPSFILGIRTAYSRGFTL